MLIRGEVLIFFGAILELYWSFLQSTVMSWLFTLMANLKSFNIEWILGNCNTCYGRFLFFFFFHMCYYGGNFWQISNALLSKEDFGLKKLLTLGLFLFVVVVVWDLKNGIWIISRSQMIRTRIINNLRRITRWGMRTHRLRYNCRKQSKKLKEEKDEQLIWYHVKLIWVDWKREILSSLIKEAYNTKE